jgi:hypothetical protein
MKVPLLTLFLGLLISAPVDRGNSAEFDPPPWNREPYRERLLRWEDGVAGCNFKLSFLIDPDVFGPLTAFFLTCDLRTPEDSVQTELGNRFSAYFLTLDEKGVVAHPFHLERAGFSKLLDAIDTSNIAFLDSAHGAPNPFPFWRHALDDTHLTVWIRYDKLDRTFRADRSSSVPMSYLHDVLTAAWHTSEKENEPNQPPLRTPASGTPAADAPVAPAVGCASS